MTPGLKRYPHIKRDLLQAWDSADELLLEHLSGIELKGRRILILVDQFGTLSCAITGVDLTTYTDSYCSYRGTILNSNQRVVPICELSELKGEYDLVLIRIPKNMSFLEDMLCQLSHHLHAGSQVICAYMIKHQANASFELLAKVIGETRTSLARKKARLIFAEFSRNPAQTPYPLHVPMPSFEIPFLNASNLFSREGVDIGTRFLLEHIPQGDLKSILDLGCGNGVVGVAAKRMNPSAEITFSDDSKMAIQSARANYERYFPDEARFHWTHSGEGFSSEIFDLVICNPPFHLGTSVGTSVAWQMFTDAKRLLVRGGTLRVIGNLHLQYPHVLRRIFGQSRVVASNQKFVIGDAIKR